MTSADDQDDPPLDADGLQAGADWRKVALVVAVAMDAYSDQYHDIPDVFYGQRVRDLVSSGHLAAQGNLRRMRFSEVRLTSLGLGDEA
jgi:hypothetical protein